MNEPKTPNLGLNKIDRSSPSTTNFDLDKYLDQNWEKVDESVATKEDLEKLREAVSEIDVPDASLTQKGKVQLSNAIDSNSEDMAATPKAVKIAVNEAISAKQLGVEQKANVVAALNSIGVLASTSDSWAQLIKKISDIKKEVIPSPGEILIFSATTSYNMNISSSTTPTKSLTYRIGRSGKYRIRFTLAAGGNGSSVVMRCQCRIYKNGLPYGVLRTTSEFYPGTTFTEDLTFDAGDHLEFWTASPDGGSYRWPYSVGMPSIYANVNPYIIPEVVFVP
ncbi:Phage tail fibre repeat-containing protein [Paenibacillus sp. ov031]|uniref:tail fiber protein n=1 Tax=Paenibacillus sp. ov031 TaxID=1761879 RepID=UPI000912367B|nr:phage tail protein [Paenibacillus sp. ov031]SHN74545.1 Phage tail fibre repeat-containing protein [Paenibacillus sp. ov031]